MFKLNELLDNAQAEMRRRRSFEDFFVHIDRFSVSSKKLITSLMYVVNK